GNWKRPSRDAKTSHPRRLLLKLSVNAVHFGQVVGIGFGDKIPDDLLGEGWRLHVEAGELDPSFTRSVELPHPEDHVEYFLRVPGPEVHALEEFFRVAVAVEHVVVDAVGFRHIGLDREYREAHLVGEEVDDAVLHPEEFARTVSSLTETDNVGATD